MKEYDSFAIENELDMNKLAYNKVNSSGIISFRKITRILGVNFHLSREQTFQLLKTWKKKGWIKIHPFHGVEFVKKD
jgi:hypothetical protein